jgi:hypothetical protein
LDRSGYLAARPHTLHVPGPPEGSGFEA